MIITMTIITDTFTVILSKINNFLVVTSLVNENISKLNIVLIVFLSENLAPVGSHYTLHVFICEASITTGI